MKLKKFLIGGIFRNLYSNPPISSDSYILQAYQLDFTRRNNLPADYFTVSNEKRGLYNEQWRQRALALDKYKLEEKHLKDEKMMRENAIVPINFGKEPTEAFQEGGKFYEDLPDSEKWDLLYNASMSMPKGWEDPEGWLDKYLKAKGIQRRLEPTLEEIMSALEGMKTPKKKLVQKVPKNQEGVKFGGSNKSNRFLPLPVNQIPELTVNGQDKRWRFSTRQQDFGNGHSIKSQHFYDAYDGGNHYLGDLSVDKGGRTIYYSPKGNDTIYWNTPTEWIWYKDGLMPIGKNEVGAKANFFKNLKRPLIKELQGGTLTHQNGGEFKENLNPPTDGVLGELKRNIRNGWQQGKRMAGSVPLNILLGGIGSGMTGINIASKAKLFANWLVKDQNPGLDQISALGWIGTGPAMGIAMFDPFRWSKDAKNEDEIKKYGASSRYDRERRAEEYRSAEPLRR